MKKPSWKKRAKVYREYFLAWEENGSYCDRVGVTKEEFDANQVRLNAAEEACYKMEKKLGHR